MSIPAPFTPVPVRARRDGWTPARQIAFVAALAELRCVVAAARRVEMSWQTAYRLRARPDAQGFAAAWDAALAAAMPPDDFTGRALGGVARPITYRGKRVGERRRYDNRLGMFLLGIRQPERWRAREACYPNPHSPSPAEAGVQGPEPSACDPGPRPSPGKRERGHETRAHPAFRANASRGSSPSGAATGRRRTGPACRPARPAHAGWRRRSTGGTGGWWSRTRSATGPPAASVPSCPPASA